MLLQLSTQISIGQRSDLPLLVLLFPFPHATSNNNINSKRVARLRILVKQV